MSTYNLIFGNRLKELRLSKGLSQYDLAAQIHLSATTINRYEHGAREPSLDTLAVIADFFNVDFNYLLGKPNMSPQPCEDNSVLLHKFHMLDDRGKSAVLNVIEHEYALTSSK